MKKILKMLSVVGQYLLIPVVLPVLILYKLIFGDNIDKMLKAGSICKEKGHLWEYGDHGECKRGCGNGIIKMDK